MTIRLPNGSMLMFFGLDDGDRIQKILGQEFYVIWMNEATEFDDDQFETLQSRLAQTNLIPDRGRLKYKMLIDCNPDSSQHFTYRSFILKQNADGDPFPDPENFVELKMLGEDNAENLPVGYLEGQNRLSAAKRRRYQAGEWKIEVEGALFYQEWTDATRITQDELPDLVRIVVAVDPAGSDGVKADETGLVVAGVDEDGHGYVLADCTLKGTPEQWGKAVAKAYEEFKAAMVVADHGYGGQMVDSTIRNAHPAIKIGTVDGKRGKVLRADGVSALYEQGKVSHVGEFKKLETQMCQFTGEWKRGKDKSPDRLDALVYALTELMIVERQVRKGRSVQASGFW
ncbi:hypothetical protein ASE85_03315 [Sphingobium sp. Leaf26]|nr:hypothetical protein ASE85_03315 [Sphingobium sp. Leaf26]